MEKAQLTINEGMVSIRYLNMTGVKANVLVRKERRKNKRKREGEGERAISFVSSGRQLCVLASSPVIQLRAHKGAQEGHLLMAPPSI